MKLTAKREVVLCVVALAFLMPSAVLVATAAETKSEQPVVGRYAEARTCDVWTGPCFANGEMNLSGDRAVFAISIETGAWQGQQLDGLKIAASLDAEGTFGTEAEGRVRAVLFVDKRASETQHEALVALAKRLAPRRLANIVKVRREAITFTSVGVNDVRVAVGGGKELQLETSPLSSHCDKICGNESKFYPSLIPTTHAHCAKTKTHAYRGRDLGARWSDPGARSAMVGRFRFDPRRVVRR